MLLLYDRFCRLLSVFKSDLFNLPKMLISVSNVQVRDIFHSRLPRDHMDKLSMRITFRSKPVILYGPQMQTNSLLPDGNDSCLSRHSRQWLPLPSEETTNAKSKTVA